MWKLLIFAVVMCWHLLMVDCNGDTGPGMYHMKHLEKCENNIQKLKIDVTQKKINRTHDVLNAQLVFEETISYDLAVRIEIYKSMDGGYKLQQMISEPSFVNFINKYAEKNVKQFLQAAGVDPPTFPVQPGNYIVNDFIFDYSELPRDGIYGEYNSKMFILKGSEEIFCIEGYMDFNEIEDDDE